MNLCNKILLHRPPSPIIEVVPVAQYEAMYPSRKENSFQEYTTYGGGVFYPIYNTNGRPQHQQLQQLQQQQQQQQLQHPRMQGPIL